ncbi:hypothetical protein [Rhizobium laguerreae]|uniref:hypothetical protein n=1 Tax=Rhizobium laguerreae TaxID=1076926 RepID=UPI001C8FDE20|nr:hypothetical protein [Rhizobium laguerreae]MBY3117298.1 hypothetical protein [Rhizobium laguerreae]
MLAKTTDQIIEEIQSLRANRGEIIRSLVDGRLFFYRKTCGSAEQFERDRLTWILRAQAGTLDKLDTLLRSGARPEAFELLASARNLFENLTWVRLFKSNLEFGHVFYEMLVRQQVDSIEGNIAQVQAEISLFSACDECDKEITDRLIAEMDSANSEEERAAATKSQYERREGLDSHVRRSFTLYGAAAKYNGYSYQAHLLQMKVLPKLEETLAECRRSLSDFETEKASLLSGKLLNAATKWNWRDRSRDVGMLAQYDFLYRYTSRLLHSTPMNLITEKGLSDSEYLLMLDYLFVTISDIYDEIEEFEAPRMADVFLIRTDA